LVVGWSQKSIFDSPLERIYTGKEVYKPNIEIIEEKEDDRHKNINQEVSNPK